MPESTMETQAPEPTPLLYAIDGETRERVLRSAERRTYDPNEIVFLQDAPCAGLFIVVSGLLKIAKVSSEGREQVLRHVSAGDSFNEVAALDGGPNPGTVTAVERSELLVVSRESLLALIAQTPGMAQTMIQALAARLRHMVELVEDLSFRQVSERVARVLLQSVAPHPGVGAGADMSRRVSQREIAEMAGTSREVVARALKAIEASGAISIEGGEIRLVDAAKLSGRL